MELLLTYISKKLRIDAHYLYKGFFWIGISTSALFIANFFRSTAFANFLAPETYGTYRYVLSIIEITTALSLTGASLVISKSVAQGFEGTYVRGMIMYLKRAWPSVLASFVVAIYFFFKENHMLGITIGVAGVLAPLLQMATMYGALLEGKKLQALNAKFQVFSTLIPTLFLIFVVTQTDSILAIVLSYFISYIATHTFFAYLANKIVKPNTKLDPKTDSFTFHLSIMGTLAVITEQLDKVLLFHFIGPAQLAMYSFASSLPQQFNVLGKGLRVLIYPKISTQSIASIKKHILWKAFLIFIITGILFLGYVIVAPFIFTTFFSQYTDAIVLSQVFALSIFLMVAIPYRSVLLAHSCTKELYQSKISAMVIRLLSLAVLLPLFSLWGVIISYLLARFAEMFFFMYMVHFKITEKSSPSASSEELE